MMEQFIKALILVVAVVAILKGFLSNEKLMVSRCRLPTKAYDSMTVRTTKIDTLFFVDSLRTTKTRGIIKTETFTSLNEKDRGGGAETSYRSITLGIGLLIFLLVAPVLQEFSFLNFFTLKFREQIAAKKEESNQAEEGLAKPDPNKEPKMRPSENIALEGLSLVERNKRGIVAYEDDPQKGKWGGKSESNGRRLTATVTQDLSSPDWFNVELKVMSTDTQKPLRGKVLFHLHDSFIKPDVSIFVEAGTAKLRIKSYGAFTVGLEADRGATRLELDLSELPDAPKLFRSR
jgi:hypothetical protein